MSSSDETGAAQVAADPLTAVAEAAGARLRAQTDEDAAGARTAAESLVSAATSAMAAGCALRDIAAAEERGENEVRGQLRGDTLKRVDRTAHQVREAEAAHHAAIGRAMRLGLSTREIAQAAHVSHGTIRAIANRLSPEETAHAAAETTPGNGGGTE